MSRLSEFTVRGARRDDGQEPSPARSTSPGPVVVLKGWRKGMDKAGVTLLLRNSGVPLAEAHEATNYILEGKQARLRLSVEADEAALRHELGELGVILD